VSVPVITPEPRPRAEQAPPLPSTLTHHQLARRDGLIKAGLALLETDEYERIQVKDVAERAGVSLGTLYHYFSSKEHLFAEVLVRWASGLGPNIQRGTPKAASPTKGASPADRLVETAHLALRAFQHQPQMGRLINVLLVSSDSFAVEMISRLEQTTVSAYVKALAPMPPEVARPIVDVVNAVFAGAVREWSMGRISIVDGYDRVTKAVHLLLDR
jgi:TetR/AcrR family transcriptional regulator, cholesterol catabolism regulator